MTEDSACLTTLRRRRPKVGSSGGTGAARSLFLSLQFGQAHLQTSPAGVTLTSQEEKILLLMVPCGNRSHQISFYGAEASGIWNMFDPTACLRPWVLNRP